MPDYFHNPYHFVPVKERADKSHDVDIQEFKNRSLGHHSHASYADDTKHYHGRIICKLTTTEPAFVGAERTKEADKNSPAEIKHFELNNKPAIPASTLRGMLSGIAEAASNSALRVLEHNRVLSYRKKMNPNNILSAIGMVLYDEATNRYSLLPLALPTLTLDRRTDNYKLEEKYLKIFTRPLLKVYLGNYRNGNPDSVLRNKETFTFDRPKYYYLKLKKDWQLDDGQLVVDRSSRVYLRHPRGRNSFVIGQIPLDGNLKPITEEKFKSLTDESEKAEYVRGILRVLGKQGRDDIPNNKRHELFIPFEYDEQFDPISIPEHVIQRFNELADERAKATKKEEKQINKHPFHLLGTGRSIVDGISTIRLKHGDLVYFVPDETGDSVAEISFSAVWRGRVEETPEQAATVGVFFSEIDEDLLPMNENRKSITPAELVFGFAQTENKASSSDRSANLSYAGKVRNSNALLEENTTAPYIPQKKTLKILSSPKPPCPTMYFKNKNNTDDYIEKAGLSPDSHEPQGRKFYLHKYKKDTTPWESGNKDHLNQKVKVKLLEKGISFYFHIDFENLNAWELGLLCYSIRPTNEFRHKIGMGKSLGLGSITINPIGLFLTHRNQRYSADPIFSDRYHEAWSNQEELIKAPGYQIEKNSAAETSISTKFEEIRGSFKSNMETIYPDILNALELLGNPNKVEYPVHTPQVSMIWEKGAKRPLRDEEKENDTFRWFVANDVGSGSDDPRRNKNKKGPKVESKKETLKHIKADSDEIPQLEEYEWNG